MAITGAADLLATWEAGLAEAPTGRALLLHRTARPDVAAAFATDELERELEPGAAEALWNLGDGFFFGSEMLLVGFFLRKRRAVINGTQERG